MLSSSGQHHWNGGRGSISIRQLISSQDEFLSNVQPFLGSPSLWLCEIKIPLDSWSLHSFPPPCPAQLSICITLLSPALPLSLNPHLGQDHTSLCSFTCYSHSIVGETFFILSTFRHLNPLNGNSRVSCSLNFNRESLRRRRRKEFSVTFLIRNIYCIISPTHTSPC